MIHTSNSASAKFTDSAEDEDGKWCIVGADSDGNRALVVPNATRGGRDPVKLWYDEARIEDAELFSTINLRCFRTNAQNTAKIWYDGANNPVNGSNPPRTTDQHDTTQDQEDDKNGGDDVPAVPGDIPQAADEDNISFVRETILIYDGKGNKTPFKYVQAKYTTSSTTSSGNYRSTEKCHVIIHAPSGWKLSNQNPSSFCTISGNGSQLVLKFKPPPAVFNKRILRDMIANFGKDGTYQNLPTGTLHPAVAAIIRAAEVGQSNSPDVIMKIKLLVKCQSVCAIEGLYKGRGTSAKLVNAAAPVVSCFIDVVRNNRGTSWHALMTRGPWMSWTTTR